MHCRIADRSNSHIYTFTYIYETLLVDNLKLRRFDDGEVRLSNGDVGTMDWDYRAVAVVEHLGPVFAGILPPVDLLIQGLVAFLRGLMC